jgi:hypothetical protein
LTITSSKRIATNCSSVLVRSEIHSRDTEMPNLLSVPPARATGAGPCGEFHSGSRLFDTLIEITRPYGIEQSVVLGSGVGMISVGNGQSRRERDS